MIVSPNGHQPTIIQVNWDEAATWPSSWISTPAPPEDLWHTEDVQFLEKVRAHILISVHCLDPKNGFYQGRIKCHWQFRTLNSYDRTTPRTRVPGIRIPRLSTTIEESRIWRHFDGDTEKTIAWAGVTVCSFEGHEIFEMNDFPFDRQVLDFQLFELVWREVKQTDVYHEGMQIVLLSVRTDSTLPDWDTCGAVLEPRVISKPGTGPSYCSRFNVKLRLQRKEKYFIYQVFMISTIMTVAFCLPLSLAPGTSHVADRLALHCIGLLTLVSFKYSLSGELPAVPYSTFLSTYLMGQIITIVAISVENIIAYKCIMDQLIRESLLGFIEDVLLYVIIIFWVLYFFWVAFFKTRTSWHVVMDSQSTANEYQDVWKLTASTTAGTKMD